MIKIAYIIDTIISPTAGTEKQLLMLLHELDRDEFEPTLICLRNSSWMKQQTFPFRVEILNLRSLLSLSFIRAIWRFRRLHRLHTFDVVQTFFVDANMFGTIAARLSGIKTIISSRRNIGYWHTPLHRFILRLLKIWTPYYLANSQSGAETAIEVEGINPYDITVIYNGLDLDTFTNIPEDTGKAQRRTWGIDGSDILIGLVANLRPVKNIESLIDAAAILVGEFQSLRFVVIGEGPLRESLQERIDRLGIGERFHLVGTHNDIVRCLAAFDIAVLCSKSESFSNSLVEYMAAGLPAVASDVGGNSEALKHQESGLLYSTGDQLGLLRELRNLLQDRTNARQLGVAARETAFSRFGMATCIKSYEKYYKQLMPKPETE
jgi:glycosyltransferase involved in cell wall biosynthesis